MSPDTAAGREPSRAPRGRSKELGFDEPLESEFRLSAAAAPDGKPWRGGLG